MSLQRHAVAVLEKAMDATQCHMRCTQIQLSNINPNLRGTGCTKLFIWKKGRHISI